MNQFIDPSWVLKIGNAKKIFEKDIVSQLKKEKSKYRLWPSQSKIFRAFKETPYDSVKVVILGQD